MWTEKFYPLPKNCFVLHRKNVLTFVSLNAENEEISKNLNFKPQSENGYGTKSVELLVGS